MIRYSPPRQKNCPGGNEKSAATPVGHLDLPHALKKAYRLLSLRAHSAYEVEKKLRVREFPATVIKEALEKLHELKYLDDDSFAFQWAHNLAVNRLYGNRKIIANLKEKGLAAHLIGKALEEVRQEIPEEDAISLLIKKKIAGKKINLQETKEKKRIFQNLLGKGFPAGLILNKLGKIPEDDFHGEDGQ